MKIEPFELERYQGIWEHKVDINLAESGVHPYKLNQLLSADQLQDLLDVKLQYIQTNGTEELRRLIASHYEGAGEENVLVTSGTAEANLLATLAMNEKGDRVAVMLPNYLQIWGLLGSIGVERKAFWLRSGDRWELDPDEVRSTISPDTDFVAVCNPNNPTGAILSSDEMDFILDAAGKADGWILSDEVYRGAELGERKAVSVWGRSDKVVVTAGLSKAYALPGLRLGWIVAPQEVIQKAWVWKDYTTIATSAASDHLAQIALEPEFRKQVLGRTRSLLKKNYSLLREWIDSLQDHFSVIDPEAGAIALVRYHWEQDSEELVEEIRRQTDVLLAPGAHFKMGPYLRFGYGCRTEDLQKGLERIGECVSAKTALPQRS